MHKDIELCFGPASLISAVGMYVSLACFLILVGDGILCIEVNCGDPGSLENGQVAGKNFTFRNTLQFSCNIGFELVGKNQTICDQTGKCCGESRGGNASPSHQPISTMILIKFFHNFDLFDSAIILTP